jgi:hypothetical protein
MRGEEKDMSDHLNNCVCDECMGACDPEDNPCGECFACEAFADDDHWWAVNRADVLQI